MTSKRAFILGAGFSKQAGMPLTDELTAAILNDGELKNHEEMQVWLADIKRRLAAVEGTCNDVSTFRLNIEQLFDFATYDVELWRMKQQLSPIGRRYGDTPWSMGESIQAWLGYMEEDLWHIIWEEQQKATHHLASIRRFTDQLSDDDTILTFNYDTLVETAFSATGRAWNHGFQNDPNGGVTILKMHGSVDWICLERRPEKKLEKFVKLFSKEDVNVEKHGDSAPQEEEYAWELWRARDTDTCDAMVKMDRTGLRNCSYLRSLAGLGRYKPLHKLPGSAPTWFTAFDTLRSAEEIYVVGFSMSAYDAMVQLHFASVIHDRANSPSKVVIVDPGALQLAERGSRIFGKALTLMACLAEDVPWQTTLGR